MKIVVCKIIVQCCQSAALSAHVLCTNFVTTNLKRRDFYTLSVFEVPNWG